MEEALSIEDIFFSFQIVQLSAMLLDYDADFAY